MPKSADDGRKRNVGKARVTTPIMSAADERYMAFEGLVQWTQAVVTQGKRVAEAFALYRDVEVIRDSSARRLAVLASHTECHFFAISANKVLEYLQWVRRVGLCSCVDFSEIDQFPKDAVRDLRNMREHVVDYFQGVGHEPTRWVIETTEFKADASSVVGNLIGGRLDWVAFSGAAGRLLPALLAQPIPFPSHPVAQGSAKL